MDSTIVWMAPTNLTAEIVNCFFIKIFNTIPSTNLLFQQQNPFHWDARKINMHAWTVRNAYLRTGFVMEMQTVPMALMNSTVKTVRFPILSLIFPEPILLIDIIFQWYSVQLCIVCLIWYLVLIVPVAFHLNHSVMVKMIVWMVQMNSDVVRLSII